MIGRILASSASVCLRRAGIRWRAATALTRALTDLRPVALGLATDTIKKRNRDARDGDAMLILGKPLGGVGSAMKRGARCQQHASR